MIKSGLSALYKMLAASLDAQFALRPQGMPFRVSAPPEDPRYWHDPTDPQHLERMQAAEYRRESRARKLYARVIQSADNNRAHYDEFDNLHDRLNPFYVAK